ATTPIYPQALDTYVKTSQRIIGNPSSLHDLGSQANRLLEQARKQIADLIQVESTEIYFTSGGTEGDNWVLKGTAIEKKQFGRHIIISTIEHPAVSETAHQGVGFIYWKHGRKLAPLLNGGGQEKNQRSSTENIAGIVSMAKALRLYLDKKNEKPEHTAIIRRYLIEALKKYANVKVFSKETDDFAPHILCFALKGIRGEVLVHALEEKQIYTSTTSACSSRKKLASSTLHGMNVPDSLATSAIRVSLDESNTIAEAEQFMIIFNQLYKKFSIIRS
ncbi:hypothetical protein HW555_014444, partial [Spodoptera exigua]